MKKRRIYPRRKVRKAVLKFHADKPKKKQKILLIDNGTDIREATIIKESTAKDRVKVRWHDTGDERWETLFNLNIVGSV